MLKQLDPDARFEQICDLEAARRISEDKSYRPERAVVSALGEPKVANATMTGTCSHNSRMIHWCRRAHSAGPGAIEAGSTEATRCHNLGQ